MASLADAVAAFEAYKAAVDSRLSELEGLPGPEDTQPLVDEIVAAGAELVPAASVGEGAAG